MKLAPGNDHFYCEYCASVLMPPESGDGVRILGEPSDAHCPLCRATLVSAAAHGMPMLACSRCYGVLIEQSVFATLVSHIRAEARGAGRRLTPWNTKELERQLCCPHCGQQMETYRYYGPGSIIIDRCPSCNVIWLDSGELARIANAPGRDRGHGQADPWIGPQVGPGAGTDSDVDWMPDSDVDILGLLLGFD